MNFSSIVLVKVWTLLTGTFLLKTRKSKCLEIGNYFFVYVYPYRAFYHALVIPIVLSEHFFRYVRKPRILQKGFNWRFPKDWSLLLCNGVWTIDGRVPQDVGYMEWARNLGLFKTYKVFKTGHRSRESLKVFWRNQYLRKLISAFWNLFLPKECFPVTKTVLR